MRIEEINYTLITDGSSDRALMNIIQWCLDDNFPQIAFNGAFADFRSLPNPPSTLQDKIARAKKYFPFHLLFIHRDAEKSENEILEQRINEILAGMDSAQSEITICVIPIRMMETWLLIDKEAIKKAAGNRNYSDQIDLPRFQRLEQVPDPKQYLHNLLRKVSGLKSRNLKKFNPNRHVHLVAEYIENFSALRNLSAFRKFEGELKKKVKDFSNKRTSN